MVVMLKVTGIVGSPRKGGNTEILVRRALQGAEQEGAETELITLHDKRIEFCDGCRRCRRGEECHIDDDVMDIFREMERSDGIIIGTPTYFSCVSAQTKALIDRIGYIALGKGKPFRGKVGAPIVVARRAGASSTWAQLIYFFFIMEMVIPGAMYWSVAYGREIGEVEKDDEGMRTAEDLGRKVATVARKLKL